MNNLTWINLIGNLFMLLNFIAGLLMLPWAVIAIFAILHAGVRISYLNTEQRLSHASQNPNAQKTITAPPMIRNVASVVTAIMIAVILYGIGYGIRYGVATFIH